MHREGFEQPQSKENKLTGHDWMYATMGEILGKTPDELKNFKPSEGVLARFDELWRQATYDQRISFAEKTKFSAVKNYKKKIATFETDWNQMFPALYMTKLDDGLHFFSPK